MLFMRCAFESRQERLSLFPFPGLKVINIRGSNLLALDLIIIGSFVTSLADQVLYLEILNAWKPPYGKLAIAISRISDLLRITSLSILVFLLQNRLMELALRDYPLDFRGLQGLLPCIPLVRTVTINMRRFNEPEIYARYLSKVTTDSQKSMP